MNISTPANVRTAASVVLAIVTALYSWEQLAPVFAAIARGDESFYLWQGTQVVDHGRIPALADAPLVAGLYGAIDVLVPDSPHWFVQAATAGRLTIFCVFWLGLYRCARALGPRIDPVVVMALACAWLVAPQFFEGWNSSDHLFMGLSALALSHLLAYRSRPVAGHLAWGSAFAGLSAMARNDGLILCVSFLLLAAWLVGDGGRASRWTAGGRHLAAAVLPLTLIIGAGVAVLVVGTMNRTYTAFEYGHLVTFREHYPQQSHAAARARAFEDVRARFGTRTGNESSVFRAIANNPDAFLERLAGSVARLPGLVYSAYGGALSAVLLLLAVRGLAVLLRTRQWWLLAAPFVWHAHLAAYFLTFWDVRYVRFSFGWLVLLAAFGLRGVASNFDAPREKAFVAAMLAAAAACAGADETAPALLAPAIPMAGAAAWLAARRAGASRGKSDGAPFGMVFALGVLVTAVGAGGQAPSLPRLAAAGTSAPEQALRVVAGTLPPSPVVASDGDRFPAAARADRLVRLYLMTDDRIPYTRRAVEDWLDERRADAVYLDRAAMEGPYGQVFRAMLDNSATGGRYVVRFADPASNTWVLVRAERADFRLGGYDA